VLDIFAGNEWERAEPEDAGLDANKMDEARRWIEAGAGDQRYRVAVVRGGRLIAEWQHGMAVQAQAGMASAAKSLFSSMLGIAIAEGKIGSADDRVVDYYPEMMDVPEGAGPKPGRFARPEDSGITFRQLIGNTSGYMKPGETPGSTFHYQTFGMNILCHAIATAYGAYDSAAPERLPGIGRLIEARIRDRIGGTWTYGFSNFQHPPGALTRIFGNYTGCKATARDMARMGLLWLHSGRWGSHQIIPEDYMHEARRTNADVLRTCPREQWQYGLGFWTNEHGMRWPGLPTDSFAAEGAGRIHIWVCPGLDLVVAQAPGIYEDQTENAEGILGRIVAAAS